jgi:hypothetical protein
MAKSALAKAPPKAASAQPVANVPQPAANSNELVVLLQHLTSRLAGMITDRMSFFLHWQEIASYFIPRRYKWLITANQGNRGSPINQKIIDNTGTIALRICASGMMAGITSPGRPWFRLSIDNA